MFNSEKVVYQIASLCGFQPVHYSITEEKVLHENITENEIRFFGESDYKEPEVNFHYFENNTKQRLVTIVIKDKKEVYAKYKKIIEWLIEVSTASGFTLRLHKEKVTNE